jgi:leucyl aminopeptidase (aminopeptidase T)
MRVAPTVTLSPEERARLLRRRGAGGDAGQRAAIILLAARGVEDQRIAREVGIDRQTAARWRRRFLTERLGGLSDSRRSFRRGTIPEEKLKAIVRETLRPAAAFQRPWSSRALGRRFGVSHMTVRRLWASYRIRPSRFEAVPARPDPVAATAAWDVVGLTLSSTQAAIVFTLHPVPPPSPGENGGTVPPSPGATWRDRDVPPLDPSQLGSPPGEADAPGTGRGARRPPASDLLGFLGELEARTSEGPGLYALVAGTPNRHDPTVRPWRIRHPRIELEWVNTYEEWTRRATGQLLALGRTPTRPRGHGARAEVARSLARSITNYREDGGRFQWAASPREIADAEAAYRLRYELAVTGHTGFNTPPRAGEPMPEAVGSEDLLRRSARTVLRSYLRLRAGERLTVESWTGTLDYANALSLEALRIGARPLVLYQDEPGYWAATTEVPARNLAQVGDHRRAALERSDAFISFFGPSDRERFHSLPNALRSRLGAYQEVLYEAAAKSGARVVQMAIGRASAASARMYGVDLGPWRSELLEATSVPPRVLHRRGTSIARRLATGREITIAHPNGTRLALRLGGRTPVVSDGRVAAARPRGDWSLVTLPAGVVTVAVDESYGNGNFVSNVPSSAALSYAVGWYQGARWEFAKGRLRRYRYEAGQELFGQSYERAGAGRDRPGAVSIGLNDRIDRAPLLEDQGLGTVTLQIGRNDRLGGRTRGNWWAWSMLRGATVAIDGERIVDAGSLVE